MHADTVPTAQFVDLHFVDEKYHEHHSQLLHKHDDVLELFYVMKGEGQYLVAGKKYFVRSGNLVICNAGVMHGEEPFRRHNMESYCCVLQGGALHGMQPNGLVEKNTEEFIQNIMQYLDTHFIEPLQLQELGMRFHISPFYLAHIFKAETGISMMKYVMCRKIGESQNLLMNTQIPIGVISEKLRFSDHCHFSTTFKKYIGITPTQYRHHFQKISN